MKMKKTNKIILLTGLMAFTLSTLTSCYFYPQEEALLAPPLIEEEEYQYKTVKAERKTIENKVNVVGYFVASKQHDLSFTTRSGYLEEISVMVGDTVSKGQVLALIDDDSLLNNIKKQEILYNNALEAYNLIESSYDYDLQLANMNLETLRDDLEKSKRLGSLSQAQLDEKQKAVKKQEIQISSLKEKLKKEKLESKKRVELEKLALDTFKLDLEKSSIKAPVDGTVNYIGDYQIGNFIKSRKTLISVAEEKDLQLQYVGKDADQFVKGMVVEVKINNDVFEGKVVMTPKDVPSEDKDKFEDTIRMTVKENLEDIKVGDSANVTLVLDKKEDVIVLPKSVVQKFGGRKVVKVLEDDIVYEKDIITGIETLTQYEVLSGIEEGDYIVK